MNYKNELQRVCKNIQKYRRAQQRLVKLREKKPSPKNVTPMKALLANITGMLKDFDSDTERILASIKSDKPYVKGDSKGLVN